ncbi:MAG: PspC domain-containing protein, partial [Anaerolineales bacterium]
LGIDPVFIRLFFVLLIVGEGMGVFIYLLLWIVVPAEPRPGGTLAGDAPGEGWRDAGGEFPQRVRAVGDDVRQAVRDPHPQTGLIIGGALILLGVISLLRSLDIRWLAWLGFDVLWPVLLIIGGVIWIIRGMRGE